MRNPKVAETILFSILFLFFLQSLSDFIEAIYAFGLLVIALTLEVAAIVLIIFCVPRTPRVYVRILCKFCFRPPLYTSIEP